jgi:hypothetical protein
MFPELRTTNTRVLLAAALLAWLVVLYALSAARMLAQFPGSYVCSDLLISWSAGYVRRGLLGELAYLLQPRVGAQLLLTGLVTFFYVLVAVRVIALVGRDLTFAGVLFLVSPATLQFPGNDIEGYGRKDVFILTAFLVALGLVRLVPRPAVALALVMAVYLVAGLIHESAWLYFPTAVAFLLVTRGSRQSPGWTRAVVGASLAYLAACFVLLLFSVGSVESTARMIANWRTYVPDAYPREDAAAYLRLGPLASVGVTVNQVFHLPTLLGYLIVMLLAAAPVVALALERRPLPHPSLGWSVYAVPLATMALGFVIASDWGRVIHLICMHTGLFLIAIRPLPPAAESAPATRTDGRSLLYAVLLIVLYALSWRLAHSGPGGYNPLWPGYIFSLHELF